MPRAVHAPPWAVTDDNFTKTRPLTAISWRTDVINRHKYEKARKEVGGTPPSPLLWCPAWTAVHGYPDNSSLDY